MTLFAPAASVATPPLSVRDARCCEALRVADAPPATVSATFAFDGDASAPRFSDPEFTLIASLPVEPRNVTGCVMGDSTSRMLSPAVPLNVIAVTDALGKESDWLLCVTERFEPAT